jgi:nucleoside-diphosphate-sugar epimerase
LPEDIPTLICDRETEGDKLQQMIVEGNFDAVVDYYAMAPEHVQDVISAFMQAENDAIKSYIFISTNMVYPGGPGRWDISPLRPFVTEESADVVGASDAPEDYGGLKLKCEAKLQQAWEEHGFPFTTIRPPSVIGPACDQRHELLQRVAMGLPVPETKTRPSAAQPEEGFRLAFSEDVADLCVRVLAAPVDTVRGKAFNVAMEEVLSLEDYVAACKDVAPTEVAAAWPSKQEANAALAALGPNYRSYEAQSCLDISKAQRVLGWKPTPFVDAMKATVEWHRPLLLPTQSTL